MFWILFFGMLTLAGIFINHYEHQIKLRDMLVEEQKKLIELHQVQLKAKETLIASMKRDRETLEQYEVERRNRFKSSHTGVESF